MILDKFKRGVAILNLSLLPIFGASQIQNTDNEFNTFSSEALRFRNVIRKEFNARFPNFRYTDTDRQKEYWEVIYIDNRSFTVDFIVSKIPLTNEEKTSLTIDENFSNETRTIFSANYDQQNRPIISSDSSISDQIINLITYETDIREKLPDIMDAIIRQTPLQPGESIDQSTPRNITEVINVDGEKIELNVNDYAPVGYTDLDPTLNRAPSDELQVKQKGIIIIIRQNT